MSATTDIQLEAAMKRGSVAPGTKWGNERNKKIGIDTRLAKAAKARMASRTTVQETIGSGKKSGNAMAAGKADGRLGVGLRDIDADEFGATVQNEVNLQARDEVNLQARDEDAYASKSKVDKSCRGCANAGRPVTEAGKKRLVNRLLGLAETQATQGSFKITPADLIRLMQLHKDMNPQRDRKVTVQWVEDKAE